MVKNINIKPKKGEDVVSFIASQLAEKRAKVMEQNLKEVIPEWEYNLMKFLGKHPGIIYKIVRFILGVKFIIYKSPSKELFEIKRWNKTIRIFSIETNIIFDKKNE